MHIFLFTFGIGLLSRVSTPQINKPKIDRLKCPECTTVITQLADRFILDKFGCHTRHTSFPGSRIDLHISSVINHKERPAARTPLLTMHGPQSLD